jgi:hypothetical protein
MVWQRDSLAAARVGVMRRCGDSIGGEGQLQGSSGRLCRARRGEGATAWSSGLQCHGGSAALITLRGGALIRRNGRKLREQSEAGALARLYGVV